MKKLFLIFVVILTSLFTGKISVARGSGQPALDSIHALLAKEKNDTAKIRLYRELLWEHVYFKQEEGLKLVAPALQLAEKTNWLFGIYLIKNSAGRIYWRMGKFEQALAFHFDALAIVEKLGDKERIVTTLTGIGQDYADNSNYPEALKYFNKAISVAKEINYKASLSALYGLVSWVHNRQGNFPESTRYNYMAMQIAEEAGHKDAIAIYMGNIAEDYLEGGKDSLALLYMDSSIAILKAIPNYTNLSLAYSRKGRFYVQLHKYVEALKYFQLGLNLGIEIGDKVALFECYEVIANANVEMGNDSEALKNYLKAAEYSNLSESPQPVSELFVDIASCYTRLKNYVEAKKYLDDAYALSNNFKSDGFLKNYYGSLEFLDSATGKWKDAYLNHKIFIRYNEKLYNEENTKKIMRTTMQYAFDKKEAGARAEQEKKDVLALQEIKIQRNIRNFTMAGLSAVLLFSIVVYRQRNKIGREKKRSDLLVVEKIMLMKEMHHRVKNNLEVINSLLELQCEGIVDVEAKAAVIAGQGRVQSIALIHHKLYRTDEVSTVEFKSFSNDLYKQVAGVFQKPGMEINFKILSDETHMSTDVAVPIGLILNELFTNTFKYAVNDVKSNTISIQLQPGMNNLQSKIIYTDNGPGMPKHFDLSKSTSLGLKVIQLLTKQLGGTLNFYNDNGSVFEIPFNNNQKN